MLRETIQHFRGLPISIDYSNVIEEDAHYHKELEVIHMLRGNMRYKMNHLDYTLKEGDILIADTEDLHRIYDGNDDVLMVIMHIDLEYFNEIYPNIDFMIFASEAANQGSNEKYQSLQSKTSLLKQHMARIMNAKENDSDDLMEQINDFVFVLVNQFQGFFIENKRFITDHGDNKEIDLERLYRMIKYIYENYDKKITLDDLASLEHLSPYYISHMIKDITGLSFQNFLNYTRVEYAEKFLVEGRMSLTQISEQCGFSSPMYLNKCFKEWHGISPSEYRKVRVPCDRTTGNSIDNEEADELLRAYLMNKEALRKVSQHIFIPLSRSDSLGKELSQLFSLEIAEISISVSELMKVATVLPRGSRINANGEINIGDIGGPMTAAQTYKHLIEKKDIVAPFDALIDEAGLPTPLYHVCSILSSIEGTVTDLRNQYMVIKNKERSYVFVVNDEVENLLKVHITTDGEKRGVVTLRVFDKNHIGELSEGKCDVRPLDSSDIYFELDPGSLLFCEIAMSK